MVFCTGVPPCRPARPVAWRFAGRPAVSGDRPPQPPLVSRWTARPARPPSGPAAPVATPAQRPCLPLAAAPRPLARWRPRSPAEMRPLAFAPPASLRAHQKRSPAPLRRCSYPEKHSPTNCMAARFPDGGLGSRTGESVRSRSHRTSTPPRFGQGGSAGGSRRWSQALSCRPGFACLAFARPRPPALAAQAAASARTGRRAARLASPTARPCRQGTEASARARPGPLRLAVRRPRQPRRSRPAARSSRQQNRAAWGRPQRVLRLPARFRASPTFRRARPQPRVARPLWPARRPVPPFSTAQGPRSLHPPPRPAMRVALSRLQAGSSAARKPLQSGGRLAATTTPSLWPRPCTQLTRS